jgi:hypothetical protein
MYVASLFNLGGPDLIVILLIIAFLGIVPALIAIPIVFILDRRSKKSPPLPKSMLTKE